MSFYQKLAIKLPAIYKARGIEFAYHIYLESLKLLNHKYFQFEPFQISDQYLTFHHIETAWIRTRRGGKSRDLSVLAVFYVLLGFNLIWLAAKSTQLKQARKYLMANPYVKKIKMYDVITMGTGTFDLSMITKGRTASQGAHILIFDEGGKINVNLLEYEYYTYARAMVAENTTGFYRIINASTPSLGSVIEEVYRNLLETDPQAISIHPYTDCGKWISPDFVAKEELKFGKWYVDQEYRCLFVPHGNQLLANLKVEESIPEFPDMDKTWGGDLGTTVMMVGIYVQGDECWVTDEVEFNWFDDKDRPILESLLNKINVEFESEGFNYYQAREWARIYTNLTYTEWSKEVKGQRLVRARQFKVIHVSPAKTPNTYKDLSSAVGNPTENIWLKDTRHPSHWMDGFMHANRPAVRIYTVQKSKPKVNVPSWRR